MYTDNVERGYNLFTAEVEKKPERYLMEEVIMKNKEALMDKVMMFASKVQTNKYLSAISTGLMGTLPILMIGSIALLIAVLPIPGWKEILTDIGIRSYLMTASTLTTSLIALYSTFAISYRLAEQLKQQPLIPATISVFSFFMLTPMATFEDAGSFLDTGWLGAKGLFPAIIVALIATRLYALFFDKKITIKMPESVPPVISNSFAGLFPAIIVGTIFLLVAFAFGFTSYGSFAQFVYEIISMPLQNLSASVWSLVFIVFIQMILWFFGLHGSLVVGSFVTALYLPMDTANMEAVAAGVANADLPNIMGKTFYSLFAGIGGAGGTLSLCILLVLMSKSKKNKAIGNLAIVPGCFTINEPIVFGYPLILNPIMAIPFITVPLIQVIVAYGVTAIGLVPKLSGVQVPFGMPVIFSGFIAGGWQNAVLQIVLVLIGIVIYYPFFKISEKQALLEELGEAENKPE